MQRLLVNLQLFSLVVRSRSRQTLLWTTMLFPVFIGLFGWSKRKTLQSRRAKYLDRLKALRPDAQDLKVLDHTLCHPYPNPFNVSPCNGCRQQVYLQKIGT
jgi:hypothetical protein